MGINGSGVAHKINAPNAVEKLFSRINPAGVCGELYKDFVFFCRQLNGRTVVCNGVGGDINNKPVY